MTNREHKGGKNSHAKTHKGQQNKGGFKKNRFNKGGKKFDKKMKAAAPTAEDLDNELMKYMGEDYQAKKLESELDSYFQKSDQQDSA